jgi:hypothetical protein
LFWAPFGAGFATFLSAFGFAAGGKMIWAHIFFALAWPFGALAFWAMCREVYKKHFRWALIFWLFVLTIALVVADFFATFQV